MHGVVARTGSEVAFRTGGEEDVIGATGAVVTLAGDGVATTAGKGFTTGEVSGGFITVGLEIVYGMTLGEGVTTIGTGWVIVGGGDSGSVVFTTGAVAKVGIQVVGLIVLVIGGETAIVVEGGGGGVTISVALAASNSRLS